MLNIDNIDNRRIPPDLIEIIEDFSLFDDWEDRYRYLIDLGRALPKMKEEDKIEENIVRGCTSRVWIIKIGNDSDKLEFVADSDAHIVRGLIALLDRAYNGRAFKDIQEIDIRFFFEAIGLNSHLSPNRRNGFFSMVEKIHQMANAGSGMKG